MKQNNITMGESNANKKPPKHSWLWFIGLYVASIAVVASFVYGVRYLLHHLG